MKKYIVLLSIILTSCSTMKIEEQIVQDFIQEKNFKNRVCSDCCYLIKDAGSYETVLSYYQIAYEDKSIKDPKKRVDFVPHDSSYLVIPLDELETIKEKLNKEDKSYLWSSKNFSSLDIPIIDKKELLVKIDNGTLPLGAEGLIVSKPILSLNKKYALIQYSSRMLVAGAPERYYLLIKEAGKWVIKLEFYDSSF